MPLSSSPFLNLVLSLLALISLQTPGFYDANNISSIITEIFKMKEFSHQNILRLRGVALDARHSPCVIMPFMENGSLQSYLRKEAIRKELSISSLDSEDDIVS